MNQRKAIDRRIDEPIAINGINGATALVNQ